MGQAILGIIPDYDGLRIEPCLPEAISGFKATRLFRGTVYNITVARAKAGEETGIWVNGKKQSPGPIQPNGSEIEVLLKI